eukprot:279524-Prymnesium_polylepis.1
MDTTSSFNNLPEALRTLVEVATLQGWSEIMYLAMDIRGVDRAPEPGGENALVRIISAAAFFIAFILAGGFILIKLFAGVVIDKFNRLRDERSGSAFMTEAQREWVETRKLLLGVKPVVRVVPPENSCRLAAHNITSHKLFEAFIMSAICINVCFMAGKTDPPVAAFDELADVLEE